MFRIGQSSSVIAITFRLKCVFRFYVQAKNRWQRQMGYWNRMSISNSRCGSVIRETVNNEILTSSVRIYKFCIVRKVLHPRCFILIIGRIVVMFLWHIWLLLHVVLETPPLLSSLYSSFCYYANQFEQLDLTASWYAGTVDVRQLKTVTLSRIC